MRPDEGHLFACKHCSCHDCCCGIGLIELSKQLAILVVQLQ